MKFVSIVGARPQFIKLAPFSKFARKWFREIIVHTGQHYDRNMSGTFFSELNIPEPDYNLGVEEISQAKQTGKMLIAIEEVLEKEKPDLVVVFGDTNSTLAGALAASKLNIPIAHIEAGLRSFNKTMPEEINRVITDHCSDFLFAPTVTAVKNLEAEGLKDKTFLCGDIMLDSLVIFKEKALKKSRILESLNIKSGKYILLTLHRSYTVDEQKLLKQVLYNLSICNHQIVFPVHPRTRKMLKQFEIVIGPNIKVIDPVGYLDFINLESNAKMIITDSGGVQKEAYLLKIPCLTLRPETEWVETVETGWNLILGNDGNGLLEAISSFQPPLEHPEIFGQYSCAEKMVDVLRQYFPAI